MTEDASSKTSTSRRILLVDDDLDFTSMMKEFLLMHQPGAWIVHTAANYNEALTRLKQHSFNLVVLDIQMPVMDGMQFLTLLKRSYPGMQVVILSGDPTPENRAYCLKNGAALVLGKLDIAGGFESIYAALENVASSPNEGFRGMLREVGLPDVLQMECLGRKSSVLEINSQIVAGRIFIEDGSIIHAEAGSLQGEPALFQLLALSGGEFHLRPFAKPSRLTIDGHWESLLMEAMRLKDEALSSASPVIPAEATRVADEPPQSQEEVVAEAPSDAERFTKEILLCSGTGELLYERQAANAEKRVRLLDLLAEKSNLIGSKLAMGQAKRLVIETPGTRLIALFDHEHKMFVRIGAK